MSLHVFVRLKDTRFSIAIYNEVSVPKLVSGPIVDIYVSSEARHSRLHSTLYTYQIGLLVKSFYQGKFEEV